MKIIDFLHGICLKVSHVIYSHIILTQKNASIFTESQKMLSWKRTHKDHQFQLLAQHKTIPQNHTMCVRALKNTS